MTPPSAGADGGSGLRTGAAAPLQSPPSVEDMVREMWDRQQISDVVLRFGRGLDAHDWDLYASTLDDPVHVDFRDLTGRAPVTTTPAKFAAFARESLKRLAVLHQYSNFHIDVDGDRASGVFYHVSRHRLPTRNGGDEYNQYGWYENRFRRDRAGTWRITHLKHGFQWADGNPTLIDVSDPAWQAAATEVFGG